MFKALPLSFSGHHRSSEKPALWAFVPFLLALTLVYIFFPSVFLQNKIVFSSEIKAHQILTTGS